MAGKGPIPKDPGQRRRGPSKLEPPRRTLKVGHRSAPPDLRDGFSPSTLSWWANWCESPMAARFLSTDWQRLVMLAELVEQFHSEPKATLLAEIRLNEAALGATEADRLRLRWDVDLPAGDDVPTAVTDEARRARILKVVNDGQ